ncbi:SRPBCC family protein [Paracrocinitomix mangrovi]|uniref:SRPBCC family protein n=1 Tax=Paracrocinitomix mangrovi TaxID=2862509 RepID=UPI001C8E2EF5|nr:SRPBCC family protein [Paracrocinitomix mangrovi]UKN03116.1 SRPBCC family protein [Paracrocinitomix mangrovi]
MAVYQIIREQKIPSSLEKVWDFIATPNNLQKITPDSMGFQITSKNLPQKMYPGMIISYKVKPLAGIKTTWVTEITHVQDLSFFVDEQRVGPYKMWHHEHHLEQTEKGVLMRDIITYEPPLKFLGSIANVIIIKRKLNQIFNYRHKAIEEMFGKYPES